RQAVYGWQRRIARRTVKATITASECGGHYGGDWFASCLWKQRALRVDQGALVWPLVDQGGNSRLADQCSFRLKWAVKGKPLFAVYYPGVIDTGAWITQPTTRPGEYHCHRGQRLQPIFVDVAQLLCIGRIGTEVQAECIQYGV